MSTLENSKHFNPGKYVKDIFIMYLREMFKRNADQIGLEGVDGSSITIVEEAGYDSESIGERPVILVSRGAWRFAGTNPNRIASFRREDNMKTYTDLINVPILFRCGSRSGLEAEYIASVAANLISMDSRALTTLGIHSITSPLVGNEGVSQEHPELRIVPVQFNSSVQSFWTARPLPAESLNWIRSTVTTS